MNFQDWEEVICIIIVAVSCSGVIWYLWHGGW